MPTIRIPDAHWGKVWRALVVEYLIMWTWLLFGRSSRHTLAHWHIVMYTRAGCHLCDDAWALLERAQRRHDFALTKVDVDANADLIARHGLEVPVVEVNGKVRFRGVVNAVLLERLFQ